MFSTIGRQEQEELEKQFEKMRLERMSVEGMKGEQKAWFKLINSTKPRMLLSAFSSDAKYISFQGKLFPVLK